MPSTVAPEVFQFEGFSLDLTRGCLRAGDRPIELRPKSFDVLRHLLKNPGRLVSKDELVKTIWPGIFVEDGALTHCVSEVRKALGDHSRRMIKTVPRRGYLFAVRVSLRTADDLSVPLTTSVSPSAEAPRLSIIVLAFANLSDDPEQGSWRSFFKHCPLAGFSRYMVGSAEDPCVVRSHLFRRPAQGRNAGNVRCSSPGARGPFAGGSA